MRKPLLKETMQPQNVTSIRKTDAANDLVGVRRTQVASETSNQSSLGKTNGATSGGL